MKTLGEVIFSLISQFNSFLTDTNLTFACRNAERPFNVKIIAPNMIFCSLSRQFPIMC